MFSPDYQYDYIDIGGVEYPIYNVQLHRDSYVNGNVVGSAIAKSISFSIEGDPIGSSSFEYHACFGDPDTDYNVGTFHVVDTSPDDTLGITVITAMDDMVRFAMPYESELDYEGGLVTIQDVLDECCTNCGVSLKAGQTIVNSAFVVDSNQFTQGEYYTQVIQAIAQISGTFAHIEQDELVFSLTTGTSKTVSLTDYRDVAIKRQTQPINTVILRNSQAEGENVTMTDGSPTQIQLVISDNPFAYTQQKREDLITDLYTQVYGFGYTAYELTGTADPTLPCGTPVQIELQDESYITSYIFRSDYYSPNGGDGGMSAPSVIDSDVQYQYYPDTDERIRRAEIIVDKAQGQITSLTEALDDTSDKAGAALATAQVNSTLITQLSDGLTLATSRSNGQNIVKGTSGRQTLDDWELTGEVITGIDDDTTSGGLIQVGDGVTDSTLQQTIRLIPNREYAYYFMYRMDTITGSTYGVSICGIDIDLDESNFWQTASGSFTAQSKDNDIIVNSHLCRLYIADLILIEGQGVSVWQQAPNEVITATMIVDDRGTTWQKSGEAYEAHADNTEFEIVNRDQNRRIAYMDKDRAQFADTVIKGTLTVQRETTDSHALRIIPVTDGVMFVIND